MTTRRSALTLLASTAAATLTTKLFAGSQASQTPPAAAQAPVSGPFTLAPLPYPPDALEPHIDAQTMTIHHDRHHQAYVNNLNAALKDRAELQKFSVEQLLAKLDTLPAEVRTAVRNNGGGHLNHDIFWRTMKRGGGGTPTGEIARALDASFGAFDKWQELLTRTAMGVFGSGWAWLSWDPSKKSLVVEPFANQDSPITQGKVPLLGVDVWEHAYYLKYQNRRADYVKNWFNVIDWDAVAQRLDAARR